VFFAALLLRCAFLALWRGDPATPDGLDYQAIARHLEAGEGFTVDGEHPVLSRPPLYPLFLAAAHRLFPGHPRAPLWLQGLVDSAAAVCVLLAAEALMPAPAALACAAIYVLHPVFIGLCALFMSETLFMGLWLLCLALLARALSSGSPASSAAAGAAFGLALLCRPLFLFYPAVLLPAYLAARPGWKRQAACWLAFCAVTAAVVAPWTARNRRVSGGLIWVTTGAGSSWWMGSLTHYPLPDETRAIVGGGDTKSVKAEEAFNREAARNWRRDWPALLARLPPRLFKFWVVSHSSVLRIESPNSAYIARRRWGPLAVKGALAILQAAILAACAAGVFMLRASWRRALVLLAPVLYVSLHVLNDWGAPRYHLPALPEAWMLGVWGFHLRRRSATTNEPPGHLP